ncbi:MAG TPA: ABC transporter ATP-binding protein [Gaiellaceae bacterium]|nr:ABC transporter ATP-binding protein [Gaiellaceae bacterium]
MSVIRAEKLTKFYGSDRGIIDLDLTVEAGEVFGFLGPNGAGKSTTIRLLLDLIRPSSGRIEVFGAEPRRSVKLRRRIGYLPGDLRLYENMSARETFAYFAGLRRMRDLGDARALASRLELDIDRPIRSLSRGNRQKVGLIQAFMHRPDLIVLDEPTVGLDPLIQQTFYALVAEVKEAGATIFLSSHVLPEVQHVADRVALIREGRLVLVAGVEELRSHALVRVAVTFNDLPPPAAFAGVAGVRELERHGNTVVFSLEGEADALVKALALQRVIAIDSHEADLEDIFLNLYQSEEARDAA